MATNSRVGDLLVLRTASNKQEWGYIREIEHAGARLVEIHDAIRKDVLAFIPRSMIQLTMPWPEGSSLNEVCVIYSRSQDLIYLYPMVDKIESESWKIDNARHFQREKYIPPDHLYAGVDRIWCNMVMTMNKLKTELDMIGATVTFIDYDKFYSQSGEMYTSFNLPSMQDGDEE